MADVDVRRRRRLVVAALAALLVVPAACSGPGSAPAEIVVLSGRDDSAGGQRQQLVNSWNLTHTTKARIVELSGSADQQHNEMVKEAQASDSEVDVFNLDVTWVAEFADAGWIDRLAEPRDAADFLPGPLAAGRYDGGTYALPFNTDAGLLYYDRDVVGCPTTWDDVHDDAVALAGRPQPRPAAVWTGQLARYDGLVVNVLEVLGARSLDQRDLFATGLPALQDAVDTLRPANDPGKVLPDALDSDESASTQALRQGEVAMVRNWPVARETLFATSSEDPAVGRDIGVCQVPGNAAVLGGQSLAVSDRSGEASEAADLVRFLTDCPAERRLYDDGGLAPTRRCAFDTSARASDGVTQVIRTAVESARPRPQGPCYIRFSSLFSQVVHRSLITGERLPPTFLDDLQRALECRPSTPP